MSVTDYHSLALSEKDNYLAFIYRLGKNGLSKFFKFPGENFSFWWFSLVAEKPTFKSDAYERLISLLVKAPDSRGINSRKNNACHELKSVFLHIFSGLYHLLYFLSRILRVKLLMRNFNRRSNRLGVQEYLVVTYFPLVDKQKARDGIFENKYIAPFHRSLEVKLKNNYAHICIQSGTDGYGLNASIALVKSFNQGQNVFFLEEFFKLKHLFLFCFYYFYFLLRFIFKLKDIKAASSYNFRGRSYDIWHILCRDFYDSFCGRNLVTSLWYILFFDELTRKINKSAKIISICEMQWWEKALYVFAKKRNIMTIGFQHSIVPELLLNYFNTPEEIQDTDFIQGCPLPDYLGTVGSITAKRFIQHGWPSQRVFVWGAQRFENLKNNRYACANWQEKRNYFVCAFSIDSMEMKKLLLMLAAAFREDLNYRIVLKNHQAAISLHAMLAKLRLSLNSEIFEFSNEPLDNLLNLAKGIIVTESSACLYALARGIPVIVPRFLDKLDCNPLSYLTDIPKYVYSPQELKQCCDEIIGLSSFAGFNHNQESFFNEYLYFPETDNDYLARVSILKPLT